MNGLAFMKRILAAVDLSTTSSLVVEQAVQLARAIGAKIKLVSVVVIAPQVPPPGIFVAPTTFHVHELIESAEQGVRELEAAVPTELRDGIQIEVGPPQERICELSRAYDPDIIVIGAHRYGLLSRALGTTASRIVNHADRPVFVVRPLPATHVDAPESAA